MHDCVHPSACHVHVARGVVPSDVVARRNLISYVETATRAQKQMLDLQHTVRAARSTLHVSGCSSSPSRTDSLLGVPLFVYITGAAQ